MTFVKKQWNDNDPTTPASAGHVNDLEDRIESLDSSKVDVSDLDLFVTGSDLEFATEGQVPIRQADGSWAPGSAGGSAARYVHTQNTPSINWTINHNLGVKPIAMLIFDDQGYELWGPQRIDTTNNQLILAFNVPTAGTATLQ